jgi:hypothetical protein
MRRFYCFNSRKLVEDHIAQIKTKSDVMQLRHNIKASDTNLARFRSGAPGIWAIDYAPDGEGLFLRHIFITKVAQSRFNLMVPEDCDGFTVIE